MQRKIPFFVSQTDFWFLVVIMIITLIATAFLFYVRMKGSVWIGRLIGIIFCFSLITFALEFLMVACLSVVGYIALAMTLPSWMNGGIKEVAEANKMSVLWCKED